MIVFKSATAAALACDQSYWISAAVNASSLRISKYSTAGALVSLRASAKSPETTPWMADSKRREETKPADTATLRGRLSVCFQTVDSAPAKSGRHEPPTRRNHSGLRYQVKRKIWCAILRGGGCRNVEAEPASAAGPER